MDFMSVIGSAVSIVSFVIFIAGVLKAFQIATTLSEIKDILTAIKLNGPVLTSVGTPVPASIGVPVGPPTPLPMAQSGEEMLRAALSMEDHPVPPTSPGLSQTSEVIPKG